MKAVLFVIGDGYAAFAEHPSIITFVQLRTLLLENAIDWSATELAQGLGLESAQLRMIRGELLAAGAPAHVARHFEREHAPLALTHKHADEHVLIGPPRRIDHENLVFDLVLTSTQDRLSDHVTGQHVSGMLLIEAGRQAAAVALETVHADKSVDYAATWSALRVSFESFAFPLPMSLHATVDSADHARTNKVDTHVAVTIRQLDRIVAQLEYEIPLTRLALLQKLEQRAALRTIEHASAHATVTHAGDQRRDVQPETRP
jgi:A-factor biosynthesis hotdog domain